MALNKKRLLAEIEKERRVQVRRALTALDEEIARMRATRDGRISEIKQGCRVARLDAAARCKAAEDGERLRARASIGTRRAAEREVRKTDRLIRSVETKRRPLRSTATERRQESDDQVRSNLAADLVPIFDMVRKQIKPGLRKSRTESFLEWAEENPGEIYALQSMKAERDLQRALKERAALDKLSRKRKISAAEVPF